MKRTIFILIIILALALLSIVIISKRQEEKVADVMLQVPNTEEVVQAEQCFTRVTTKTAEKPFSVEEYMRLEFDGDKVTGMKFGFQDGPGYSNGYTGTLSGTKTSTEIMLYFAYTVEGSSNTEQEIYQMTNDGIEKIQHQLIEKDNILVPNRSTPGTSIPYTKFSCAEFTEKMPK